MSEQTFRAWMVEEVEKDEFHGGVKQVPLSFLPEHEVWIRVHYSSLNYKDALSASGNKGVTRKYPHVPGIDAAGVIEQDRTGTFSRGEKVVVTGRDLGSNTPGGFGELIRVPADWVLPLPDKMELKSAMTYGTAGFTAMYGVKRLQREHILPDGGKVLVTGATGGVGSLAVFFLSSLGYEVVAATGKMEQEGFLRSLGAQEIIHRDEVSEVSEGFLLNRKWNGCIETVGGSMLDAVIRQTNHDGAIACCGNILGHEVSTNIYPFILRGVSLLGIDSAICKMPMRREIWKAMAEQRVDDLPDSYVKDIALQDVQDEVKMILKGQQVGRVVLHHDH